MTARLSTWLCGLLLAVAAAAGAQAAPAAKAAASNPPLIVFAAASLKESLDEAAALFQKDTGQAVVVSYAASSTLARQIEQGAPADVFLSADVEWMDYLHAHRLLDGRSRRNLLGNTLVLVAPASGDRQAIALKPGVDLLPRLAGGRIALGMVDSVPAGKYAKAAFTSLGIWPALQPHVAEADSVRAALMLVARGETPLGVVYGTDALAEPKVAVVATFADDTHPPIIYPVARIARSRHPAGMPFALWLASPAAEAIFLKHGFKVP